MNYMRISIIRLECICTFHRAARLENIQADCHSFTGVCLFTFRGGRVGVIPNPVPPSFPMGVPPSFPMGVPPSFPMGGTPSFPVGGYPPPSRWGGYPILPKGGGLVLPSKVRMGVPPYKVRIEGTPNWNSTACTCYAVGGLPLEYTQEDFLVYIEG